jgi:hypothetical protein
MLEASSMLGEVSARSVHEAAEKNFNAQNFLDCFYYLKGMLDVDGSTPLGKFFMKCMECLTHILYAACLQLLMV